RVEATMRGDNDIRLYCMYLMKERMKGNRSMSIHFNPMLLSTVLLTIFTFANGQKDDPELFMTATEMIRYWGYPAEEHSATTTDGYILGMHRIPKGLSDVNPAIRPVVFMQHGLESDTTSWIANLPYESAGYLFFLSKMIYLTNRGFVFADAGFDVWMGNARGNTYSKKHVNLTSDDEKFWEFSWDEMQQYDLEAMINYVLLTTGQKSLYYIGHSQGTLTMFAKLSLDPSFAPKIKKFFALAPVGSVAHIQGSLHELADKLTVDIELYYELFGSGEFTPNSAITDLIAQWVCGTTEKGEDRCDNILFGMMGPEMSDQFNKSRTEVYVAHNPAGTSTQNIIHWAQMVEQGTVTRFDYGSSKKNYQHYGMNTPPLYDFSTIKTDMYLYWSDLDYLADAQDVQEYLIPALNPEYLKLNQFIPGYTHIDFIWGLKATNDLYNPIIEIIREDLGGSIQC
ncbi:hypothetical protein PRIPAC_73578, partial [Pristionchus pacificus]